MIKISQKNISLLKKIITNKMLFISLVVIILYIGVAILSSLHLIVADWSAEVGEPYAAPSFKNWLGTDIFGRSVLKKTIKGTESALIIGIFVPLISTIIGIVLGGIAGYCGGKIDQAIILFYTTLSSIPSILLLISFSLILEKGLIAIVLALGLTSWVELCRLIRGEVLRHKNKNYIHAARVIGTGDMTIMFKHILPNIFHVVIINFSLQAQYAIKMEVILSYIGLGVQGQPTWGKMIDDAKIELIRGVWWQLFGATFAMLIIVLAINLVGDALRDALDPKLKGRE